MMKIAWCTIINSIGINAIILRLFGIDQHLGNQ